MRRTANLCASLEKAGSLEGKIVIDEPTSSTRIEDAGLVPVDVGRIDAAAVMEAPRRAGAVDGEEYREPEARAAVEARRAGRPRVAAALRVRGLTDVRRR